MKKTKEEIKATKFIAKGDKHKEKGNLKKAYKFYLKSQMIDPDNPAIYDKLIQTHELALSSFSDEDFAQSLEWTMRKQELLDPNIKRLHAKLTPEWETITRTIFDMMKTTNPTLESEFIEKLKNYGESAIYPLVEYLLVIKKKATLSRAPDSKSEEKS